jgi:hypothetical protein
MAEITLWLDTSVAWSASRVRVIANLAQAKGIKVVVHAQAHLETCRQTREAAARDGKDFSADRIRSFLEQLEIEVADGSFDQATVEAWAELLHLRYPTSKDWRRAKFLTVKASLPPEAHISVESVPMTTDWLMALEAERQGAYVSVGDKGEEWEALRAMNPKHALSYEETLAWLKEHADV